MQFDFNVGPNQSQHIDVVGTFVKYKSGTGTIRVRLSGGGAIDLLPGQGVHGINFTSIDVQDRTGAQNAGTVLAGIYDFRDDRISGTVDVVDGGKARTLSGKAFQGAVALVAGSGLSAYAQILNPAGSGKNLVIEAVTFASDVARPIDFGPSQTQLSTQQARAPLSKRFGAAAATTVAQFWYQSNAGDLLQNSFGNIRIQANQSYVVVFNEPIVVQPGYSMMFLGEGAGLLAVTVEYFEEPIL